MQFSDLELSRKLERAEGRACLEFAVARSKIDPASGAAWVESAGAYAVFDGVGSPATQTFGLGLFEPLTPSSLDTIERFFFERGAAVEHEVSPLAGVGCLDLLCARGYRPIELSSVMHCPVRPAGRITESVTVRVADVQEVSLWARLSAQAWAHEHPEMTGFLEHFGKISFARANNVNFLAEWEGEPCATAALSLYEEVALFAGASVIPEKRRRGLQAALLEARMQYAFEQGYRLAMMVAEAGSQSQRNAERKDFRIAYTRTKWRRPLPG